MPPPGSSTSDWGTPALNPHSYFTRSDTAEQVQTHLGNNDLRRAIIVAFNLQPTDNYIYHAVASVTLAQVQQAIGAGTTHGLCDWYLDASGTSLGHPTTQDTDAYTAVFDPRKSAPNTLKSLASNAKKGSLRADIATHLLSKRHLDPKFSVPKKKSPPFNPYLDFWVWSCRALAWAGPSAATANVKTSHAVLPIFMHHFGCVVPSHEALEIIRQVAAGRPVCDVGSGNGYWTFMLRSLGLTVHAVDNQQSEFRAQWVGNTIIADGEAWLKGRGGAKDEVLLLVYPVVGGDFLKKMLAAYQGKDVCVVGTQNGNGYTAFKDRMIDEYMAEERKGFRKTGQISLPSFAGKDDALFVFQKED